MLVKTLLSECTMANIVLGIPVLNQLSKPHKPNTIATDKVTLILTEFSTTYLNQSLYSHSIVS